jgi:hypothetical protein
MNHKFNVIENKTLRRQYSKIRKIKIKYVQLIKKLTKCIF